MIPVCRYPGCRSDYAGAHTWHPVWIVDCYTGDVVREATRADIERALADCERLVEYAPPRWGYLVRLVDDPQEGMLAIPLDDSEIAALVGGAS